MLKPDELKTAWKQAIKNSDEIEYSVFCDGNDFWTAYAQPHPDYTLFTVNDAYHVSKPHHVDGIVDIYFSEMVELWKMDNEF